MSAWEVGLEIAKVFVPAGTAFGGGYLGVRWSARQRRLERAEEEWKSWRERAAPVLGRVDVLIDGLNTGQFDRLSLDRRAESIDDLLSSWRVIRPELLAVAAGHPDADVSTMVWQIDFALATAMDFACHGARLLPPAQQPSEAHLRQLLDALRAQPGGPLLVSEVEWKRIWTAVSESTMRAFQDSRVLQEKLRSR